MTRSTIALAAAVAAVAFTAGCSAGLKTQTDQKVPSVPGTNAQVTVSSGGSIAVRNALVSYPGPKGYPVGGTAPLEVRLFNDTRETIRLVDVSSPDGRVVLTRRAAAASLGPTATTAVAPTTAAGPTTAVSRTAGPTGSAVPSGTARPSGSAVAPAPPPPSPSPAPAVGGPVAMEIPASEYVSLSPGSAAYLQLTELSRELKAGDSVTLTFVFSDNVRLDQVRVPVGPPASAAPRSPMVFKEDEH